jgi:23S rRNA G2069 N7-methylase RlmK/C1962 C5-methylase RlmI
MTTLPELLRTAIGRRAPLLARLHGEGTDCYRLLHGVTEGAPGMSIDRYGSLLLLQTWREPLAADTVDTLAAIARHELGVELDAASSSVCARATAARIRGCSSTCAAAAPSCSRWPRRSAC